MTFFELALKLHIAIGSVVLAAFWTSAILRKGTLLHRRIGDIYMLAMIGVMLTALPLATKAFIAGRTAFGIFLLDLALLTGTANMIAWRAVQYRHSVTAYIGAWYRPLAWINLTGGMTIFVVGVYLRMPLICGMSVISLAVGLRMLRFLRHLPSHRGWWLQGHYIGIIAGGVAAHISFLNIGLQRWVPIGYSTIALYLAWFGPFFVAIFVIAVLNRRHMPQPATPSIPRVSTKVIQS